MHSMQMASLLMCWFRTTFFTLPLLSTSHWSFVTPPPVYLQPRVSLTQNPLQSTRALVMVSSPHPFAYVPCPWHGGPLRTVRNNVPTLPSPHLCCSCEQSCSCVSSLKVALCCGYISPRNRAEAARNLTERTEELLDAKGFQLVEAWIRYRLENSRYMAPISHYQFPWAVWSPTLKALI